jgi:hypothetical protein
MIPSQPSSLPIDFAAYLSPPQHGLIICLVLAVVFVSARNIARWLKERAFGAEDYFCWLAIAAYISLIGLYLNILTTIYTVTAVALGQVVPPASFTSDGNHMMRCMFAIQLLFWTTLYSVKFSLLFLCRRLTVGLPTYEMVWTGVVIFTILSFIGSLVSELTSCKPLRTYFFLGMLRPYFFPLLYNCCAAKLEKEEYSIRN